VPGAVACRLRGGDPRAAQRRGPYRTGEPRRAPQTLSVDVLSIRAVMAGTETDPLVQVLIDRADQARRLLRRIPVLLSASPPARRVSRPYPPPSNAARNERAGPVVAGDRAAQEQHHG